MGLFGGVVMGGGKFPASERDVVTSFIVRDTTLSFLILILGLFSFRLLRSLNTLDFMVRSGFKIIIESLSVAMVSAETEFRTLLRIAADARTSVECLTLNNPLHIRVISLSWATACS
jgi:hypothetical protein